MYEYEFRFWIVFGFSFKFLLILLYLYFILYFNYILNRIVIFFIRNIYDYSYYCLKFIFVNI